MSVLTRREIEVLELKAQGLTAKEVAMRLGLKPGTVKQHLSNVYRKLDVANEAQAVYIACKVGWL